MFSFCDSFLNLVEGMGQGATPFTLMSRSKSWGGIHTLFFSNENSFDGNPITGLSLLNKCNLASRGRAEIPLDH